ncbi:alpha/beta fold hydrolase [Marinomonas agarivorans]|nr:alpha/beta fold hydrolase [Marinomonas agarivorans]
MKTEKITFANKAGHSLAGLIDIPTQGVKAYALFAHCFTCTKNLKAVNNISAALAKVGIATLRFDFTGLGQSDGDFAETNFSSNVEDLLAAADFLSAEYKAPKLLIGHSLGGTAILQAAQRIESAKAVVTIGSPSYAAHVAHLLSGSKTELEQSGEADVKIGGRHFKMRKQFLDDLAQHQSPTSISSMKKALLIFHSPIDTVVSVDNAAELYRHASHPKSFVSLDTADHLMSNPEDSIYVGETLASWCQRYISELKENVGQGNDLNAVAGAVVARTAIDSFKTDIRANQHSLVADEPVSVLGGTDLGPSPYGLLSAALASCTTMTLKMYASHKGLALDDVTVEVTHDKIHAQDCASCETKTGKVDRFQRKIYLRGDLDDAQRQRLLEIADRCPVHKTLHSDVEVTSELID